VDDSARVAPPPHRVRADFKTKETQIHDGSLREEFDSDAEKAASICVRRRQRAVCVICVRFSGAYSIYRAHNVDPLRELNASSE